jgi:hypothetical protein
MYFVLSWRPRGGTSHDTAHDAIVAAFHVAPFENVAETYDGQIVGNVGKNRPASDFDDLAEALRDASPNTFTFTLCRVPRGAYIEHSTDVNGDDCDRVVEYG